MNWGVTVDEMNSKSFMGVGLSFPMRINAQTGRFALSRHEDNIHESVKLILNTFRGERVMRPEFGGVSENVLFSDLSAEVLTGLRDGIKTALESYEPRIADVSVKTERVNQGELIIEISYRVRTTNNLFSRVYPFYVLEGAGEGA